MKVLQAKTAGFCYGVERAVALAEQTARERGSCVMLGSIVHNEAVIRDLAARGVRQAAGIEDIRPGDTVLIRAHGERREVYEALEQIGARPLDATCPNVRHIRDIVAQAARDSGVARI